MSDELDREQRDDPPPSSTDNPPLFPEETRVPLTDRDRDRFLISLDDPPPANAALKNAACRLDVPKIQAQ